MLNNISLLDKIKWSGIGLIFLLSLYNTYQIILINEQLEESSIDNSGVKVTPEPAPKFVPKAEPTPKLNSFAKIAFMEEIKDFGNVDPNSENKHSFVFTNTGSEPLKILNAKGSCSCTVPNFSEDPVMPGKQGSIEVIFSPKISQAGKPQEQTVTITSNTDPETSFLKIKANVNPQ